MLKTNPEIDLYLAEGCGRCPRGGTPDCKVHAWQEELRALRTIVLESGLTEERKWKIPCYTFQGANVAIVAAFNDNTILTFFKGTLLSDPAGILEKPGENSHVARVIRFTNVQQIADREATLRACLQEAIDVEKAGLKPPAERTSEPIPEELEERLAAEPDFSVAWDALTPGRQRGYLLFFNGAKQSATRAARIEKHIPDILAGRGIHDDYKDRMA